MSRPTTHESWNAVPAARDRRRRRASAPGRGGRGFGGRGDVAQRTERAAQLGRRDLAEVDGRDDGGRAARNADEHAAESEEEHADARPAVGASAARESGGDFDKSPAEEERGRGEYRPPTPERVGDTRAERAADERAEADHCDAEAPYQVVDSARLAFARGGRSDAHGGAHGIGGGVHVAQVEAVLK